MAASAADDNAHKPTRAVTMDLKYMLISLIQLSEASIMAGKQVQTLFVSHKQ
jgi:hypothetical protein